MCRSCGRRRENPPSRKRARPDDCRRRRGTSSTTSTTSTCRPAATSTALRDASPRRSTTWSRPGDCRRRRGTSFTTRPRPRTEPPCGAVPDRAEPAGDEASGGAGPGDDPGEDALLAGTGGLIPSGGPGLSSSGVPPEVSGASLAGVDAAGSSPRSRLLVSQICSRSSIADRSPTASPTARSGESESAEWLEVQFRTSHSMSSWSSYVNSPSSKPRASNEGATEGVSTKITF